MKSDSQAPADLIPLLRQQLILAQVRIMELEDARDELAPRLAETAALLGSAQTLAERGWTKPATWKKCAPTCRHVSTSSVISST